MEKKQHFMEWWAEIIDISDWIPMVELKVLQQNDHVQDTYDDKKQRKI